MPKPQPRPRQYKRTLPNLKVRSRRRVTLTPNEVADVTGFGRNHVYRMLRSGELPALRIGNRFYIVKATLTRWLEKGAA